MNWRHPHELTRLRRHGLKAAGVWVFGGGIDGSVPPVLVEGMAQ